MPAAPHVITSFGGHGAAGRLARMVQMGALGESAAISVTPEYAAACALAAALHDPALLAPVTWAVAMFQRPGEAPRFVVAGSQSSWSPAGLYWPSGVTLAHHDPVIDESVRQMWHGVSPSQVLAAYARLTGEVPAVVVVRA
jgi:hypothetical protein